MQKWEKVLENAGFFVIYTVFVEGTQKRDKNFCFFDDSYKRLRLLQLYYE